jgi:hypothetical protein
MKRIQYIAGLTYITWGLLLITPLYLHFSLSDAFVVVPLICLLLLAGITIIKGWNYSWTLCIVLGFLILVHYIISIFNEIFKETDMVRRYKTPEVILFTVWSTLVFLTLYSILSLFKTDVKTKMNIGVGQFKLTMIVSVIIGLPWIMFLLKK